MIVNLNDVLLKAREEKYAVGLFNTTDTDMLQAVIDTAEDMNSPVIIGTAEVLLPYGELALISPAIIARAKAAKVPVVVHYDHGLTFDRCMEALKLGFSSVMFDGSAKKYAQNVAETAEMVKIAHSFGASVEGEIGHVGNADVKSAEDRYTTIEEAVEYYQATKVDALAIAVGTAHGEYKTKPVLNFERIAEIKSAIPAPLVLHGGSGLSDSDFRNSIKQGISKVNIFTDLCLAGVRAMKYCSENNIDYLNARNRKVDEIKKVVAEKIKLFGSENKA